MANFKIVISDPKARKAYQKELDQGQAGLLGKKIGDKFQGSHLGLAGFELEVTGGSDKEGFPMRRDVEGPGRKKILLSHGPGFHPVSRGRRKRKSICGNTVSPSISQINVKIISYGQKSVEESLGMKAKESTSEEKKEHAEKKEEHAHKHAEKPVEKKEEPKAE